MSEEIVNTAQVEVSEPEVKTESAKAPEIKELKENGWSEAEIESAQKRGMIPKKKEKKEEEAKTVEKPEVKIEGDPEDAAVTDEKRTAPRLNGQLPDFSFKTPEQEKAWLDAFGPGTEQRAMYFRMKNERQSRQRAEQERDRIKAESEAFKARLDALEKGKVETGDGTDGIDPDDQPLTARQLREMQQKELEERQKQDQELQTKAQRNAEAIKSQEEFARSIYPDFEERVKAATHLMQNLDILQPWERSKAEQLFAGIRTAAQRAEEFGIDDYNASLMAYELGKMHPDFRPTNGQSAELHNDGESDRPDTKANGSHTPEKMKRIEANTQRRASSASIPGGGGKRSVTASEVTIGDFVKFNAEKRAAFKRDHPEDYKRLRG